MQEVEHNGTTEPGSARPGRRADIRTVACVVLALAAVVEGVLLVRLTGRRARADGSGPGGTEPIPYADRQPVRHPVDNQVVYWEAAEELDTVRHQVGRLIHDWAARSGGPLRGMAAPPGSAQALSDLQAEIERLFEVAVHQHHAAGLPARLASGWTQAAPGAGLHIETKGSNYSVAVSLPNCDPADIRAVLDGALLTIAASPSATGGATGPLETRIRLPDDMDRESLRADYRDGVLRVRALRCASNSLVRPITIH